MRLLHDDSSPSLLRGRGVIALADLHLHAIAAAFYSELAEAAVQLGVAGRIAGQILGAQLIFDLLEGSLELFAIVAHINEAATGLLGQLRHGREAAIAKASVKAPVSDQDYVDDDVGPLRRGDGVAHRLEERRAG